MQTHLAVQIICMLQNQGNHQQGYLEKMCVWVGGERERDGPTSHKSKQIIGCKDLRDH